MATIISTGKGTVDRKAVITLALLYFVRDDYPDEEEPYVKIAKDLLPGRGAPSLPGEADAQDASRSP